jgi:hypothetical protein
MPILRYMLFVGGGLLALLFICDAALPRVPLPQRLHSGTDLPAVRIQSDRKLPERVVIDTSASTLTALAAANSGADRRTQTAEAPAAAAGPREAFARLTPVAPAKVETPVQASTSVQASKPNTMAVAKAEDVKPRPKRKIARARASHPMMLVAQQPQPHLGWFDSTW